MGQISQISYDFHLHRDDLAPALKVKLYDGDTGDAFNLDGYTAEFYMTPVIDRDNIKIMGSTANITNAAEGEVEYRWSTGDTDEEGKFYWEMRFTKSGKSFRIPVRTPGIVVIERSIAS